KTSERKTARRKAQARLAPGADRRAAERRIETAEREVQRLEARIAELEGLLADTGLYDGTGAAARRAAELGRELDARREALGRAAAAPSSSAMASARLIATTGEPASASRAS